MATLLNFYILTSISWLFLLVLFNNSFSFWIGLVLLYLVHTPPIRAQSDPMEACRDVFNMQIPWPLLLYIKVILLSRSL